MLEKTTLSPERKDCIKQKIQNISGGQDMFGTEFHKVISMLSLKTKANNHVIETIAKGLKTMVSLFFLFIEYF